MGSQRAGYNLSDRTTKAKGRTTETVITRDWEAEAGIDYKGKTQGDFRGNGTTPPHTHHDCGARYIILNVCQNP